MCINEVIDNFNVGIHDESSTGLKVSDNTIAGNYIGTDVTGTVAIRTIGVGHTVGVLIQSNSHHNLIGTDGNGVADVAEANSIARSDVAPLILNVAHAPVVPRSSDPVTITAGLLDEQPDGLELTLHWKLDGSTAFTAGTKTAAIPIVKATAPAVT